jgi:hypothetical protein
VELQARVTIAENPDTSPVIARSRAENVPKAVVVKAEEDTTAVAAVDPVAAITSAVAGAALIRAPDAALRADCPLEPNADRLLEMALLELLAGVASLPATVRTVCGTTGRPGSGVTTASSGPQATEQPHTRVPNEGAVAKTRKRTPISGLWPLQKRRRFCGSKLMPT